MDARARISLRRVVPKSEVALSRDKIGA